MKQLETDRLKIEFKKEQNKALMPMYRKPASFVVKNHNRTNWYDMEEHKEDVVQGLKFIRRLGGKSYLDKIPRAN